MSNVREDKMKKDIEKILDNNLDNFAGESHLDYPKAVDELTTYIKEREREALNKGLLMRVKLEGTDSGDIHSWSGYINENKFDVVIEIRKADLQERNKDVDKDS